MIKPTAVDSLVGEELSAIAFVRDYVEFHFDGPIFRSLASPVLIAPSTTLQFPEPGSRDGLCELIGEAVSSFEDASDALRIEFRRTILEIPKFSPDAGPEVAQFIPLSDGAPDPAEMIVWENLRSTM